MDRAEMNVVIASKKRSLLAILACVAVAAAGILHLMVAPEHYADSKGHGLSLAILGVVELAWALVFFFRPNVSTYTFGAFMLVASIFIWVAALFIASPLVDAAEETETIVLVVKGVELVALLLLSFVPMIGGAPTGGRIVRPVLVLLVVALLLGAIAGGASYGAGILAVDAMPELGHHMDDMDMGATSTGSSGGAHGGMEMSGTNATNETSGGNATNSSAPPPQYNYDNCMVGMDMPGCPAAVAEERYRQMMANATPDKQLPNLKIELTPQGDQAPAKFTLDTGVQQLLVGVYINDSGPGPWATVGPQGTNDITVVFKSGTDSSQLKTITLTQTAQSAGADPVQTANKGPYTGIVTVPAGGDWTATVNGSGQNVHVDVTLTERFTP